MNKKASIFFPRRIKVPSLVFLHLTGNRGWDYAILGAVGVFVVALLVYGIWMGNVTNPKIQYTPADVVYGEKIRAVHAMSPSNNSQYPNLTSSSSTAKPEIRLSEKYYDFGAVNADQILTRTFVIANSGQSTLVIQRAYTTCGCTSADFTATEIPPGKVALMTLQFDTGYHDLHGTTVRRGVMIETNDPEHPTQEIWIQASVR